MMAEGGQDTIAHVVRVRQNWRSRYISRNENETERHKYALRVDRFTDMRVFRATFNLSQLDLMAM